MTKNHTALKETARVILKEMGFKRDEIFDEYEIGVKNGKGNFRVDVAGIKKNQRVAIECGNTPGEKIAALKMFFDEVIVLPFFKLDITDRMLLRELRAENDRLKEMITNLNNEVSHLKGFKSRENEEKIISRSIIEDFIELTYRLSQENHGENYGSFFYNRFYELADEELIKGMKRKLDELLWEYRQMKQQKRTDLMVRS